MDKKYQIIYADPPWRYSNKKTGATMKSGAESKYPTMSLDEICQMDVPSDKNSILFLWVTAPLLQDGFTVMNAWGFKYKTIITWRKIMSLGMGYWFRGQTEFMLLGIKGKVKAFRMQEINFIQSKAKEHSHKPIEARRMIERVAKKYNITSKLELFARQRFEGWDAEGNELDDRIYKSTQENFPLLFDNF